MAHSRISFGEASASCSLTSSRRDGSKGAGAAMAEGIANDRSCGMKVESLRGASARGGPKIRDEREQIAKAQQEEEREEGGEG